MLICWFCDSPAIKNTRQRQFAGRRIDMISVRNGREIITQPCVFHIQAAEHADKPAFPPRHSPLSRRASKSDVSPAQVHKKSPLTRVNSTKVLKDVIADVTEADMHTALYYSISACVISALGFGPQSDITVKQTVHHYGLLDSASPSQVLQ